MNALQNFGFKVMMKLLVMLLVCLALYALIWKLAEMMFLLLLMAPFAIVIIWYIKKVAKTKLAPSEQSNNPPYKV